MSGDEPKKLTVNITHANADTLDDLARYRKVPKRALVEQIIEFYIDHHVSDVRAAKALAVYHNSMRSEQA